MMNNRLVTLFGGGGFVGRYVAQALLRAGARVRIAQRDPRQAFFLKPQGGLGQTQFIAADVTRPDTIARALAGADAAVNLVGRFDQVDRVNGGGARVVAEAAATGGLQALVHVSAIGADATARAGYARSKGEGEAAVRQAFPAATILRPATIFGREDQFLNRFAGMVARLPVVPVLRGETRFQPVFVADVAEAAAAALSAPERFGGLTFELGGPDVLTLEALNRWLADVIERRPSFVVVPDALGSLVARGGFLPGAPITWDQWLMLGHDTIADPALPGLTELGVTPTPMDSVAPSWLVRFRRNGRFGDRLQELA